MRDVRIWVEYFRGTREDVTMHSFTLLVLLIIIIIITIESRKIRWP